MKRYISAVGIILVAVLLMAIPASAAKPGPATTITLLNPPPGGLLTLNVGESHTFNILVTSSEPFVSAMAKVDIFYPGKGVFWHAGSDSASQATSAVLHLTVIGKKSTAGLPAVCDWPTEGTCWPEGVAPQDILAGVRFKGGQVSSNAFPFAVLVP
jgi:hypothetical protein